MLIVFVVVVEICCEMMDFVRMLKFVCFGFSVKGLICLMIFLRCVLMFCRCFWVVLIFCVENGIVLNVFEIEC